MPKLYLLKLKVLTNKLTKTNIAKADIAIAKLAKTKLANTTFANHADCEHYIRHTNVATAQFTNATFLSTLTSPLFYNVYFGGGLGEIYIKKYTLL